MPRVTVHLPALLATLAGDARVVDVEADTIAQALACLIEKFPVLGVHLFDERSRLRPHVLCLHNETNTRWLASLAEPLAKGDRITILQAVSGG